MLDDRLSQPTVDGVPMPDPLDTLLRNIDNLAEPLTASERKALHDARMLAKRHDLPMPSQDTFIRAYRSAKKTEASAQAVPAQIQQHLNERYWLCAECNILHSDRLQYCPLCEEKHLSRLNQQQIDARGVVILSQQRELERVHRRLWLLGYAVVTLTCLSMLLFGMLQPLW